MQVELSKLSLHIFVEDTPFLELATLLLVAVPQISECVVQLYFHLPDDPHLQ